MTTSKLFLLSISSLVFAILPFFVSCRDQRDETTPVYPCRVVKTYPHDTNAFTQGLVFDGGFLYEGTGLYGRSSICKMKLETLEVLRSRQIPEEFFGEGITVFGDKLILLTLHAGIAFVYDKQTFDLVKTFSYPGQGWGITHDSNRLILSDGSPNLRFLEPVTFELIGSIKVTDQNTPIAGLNELEYIDGRIYANIWRTNRIAIILPDSGRVTAYIDLSNLFSNYPPSNPVDVLNGIAYDADRKRLFVTGKFWPKIFQIKLVP